MIEFINSITDTILSIISFFISLIQGFITLIDMSISFINNVFVYFDFMPSNIQVFIILFSLISILLFFLNRRVS